MTYVPLPEFTELYNLIAGFGQQWNHGWKGSIDCYKWLSHGPDKLSART